MAAEVLFHLTYEILFVTIILIASNPFGLAALNDPIPCLHIRTIDLRWGWDHAKHVINKKRPRQRFRRRNNNSRAAEGATRLDQDPLPALPLECSDTVV